MKTLKIGVCGVGNVGGAVLENLANSPSIVEDNGGVRIEIIQVGARKGKSVVPYDLDVVTDLMEVARNPNIDVLVELIGGCDLAKDLIEEAIKNGKHIVTANKALIATYGDELFELAKEKKVQIGFEASVAGGTPVIKALREGLVANKVNWFAGILNGTTNFILSKMSENQSSFKDALKEAQDLGFAEADPTADVEGHDARSKISLLCRLTLGAWIKDESISCTGISTLTADDFEYAKILKSKIKLLGVCKSVNDGTGAEIFVSPVIVPLSNTIASVNGATNIVEVRSKYLGTTYYVGAGAGRFPTATSIVSDMLEISMKKSPKPFPLKNNLTHQTDYPGKFYIRINIRDATGIIRTVGQICEENGVSIYAVLQIPILDKQNVPFVITTDETLASKVKTVVDSLEKQSWCLKRPLALPFL